MHARTMTSDAHVDKLIVKAAPVSRTAEVHNAMYEQLSV